MATDTSVLPPVRRTVLVADLHDLSEPPRHLSDAIATAVRQTTENLRIALFSELFNPPEPPPSASGGVLGYDQSPGVSRTAYWDEVQRLLTYVYVQATKVAQDMGRVLMDIDVLLQGAHEPFPDGLVKDSDRVYCVTFEDYSGLFPSHLPLDINAITLRLPAPARAPDHPTHRSADPPLLPVVAMGGTFDHLHAGHKILLSMGAWIAREKLIVGITDDALLKNKAYKEVLEGLEVRTQRTRAFLELFKPGIYYDLVPISDVYGPTAWDPNVQALVVSKETLPGASSIHKLREEKSLPALRTFVIDVISATEASLDDSDASALKSAKMSSTYIRQWLVEQQRNQAAGP